ncbi:hypothetical protein F2Q70_00029870 [Brassica cretica]|uniref:Uncharacterized protein n=1 Tax=Brassica cretica TaxID=69181 RepID=A0A8S9H0I9_BRACR|nr:hypothetical protein F2Q70_00029870 [Brassica cretica]KAF2549802.1 hypothetical protein F2Q68_00034338 [Brassica cretica]
MRAVDNADSVSGSGTFWKTLEILEPFEVQNCDDASDVELWAERPTHGVIEPIIFTKDRSLSEFSNSTGLSCRGDERMSIDDTALLSIDGDPTRRAEPITWPTYAQKLPQVTRIPLDDSEPYLCVF